MFMVREYKRVVIAFSLLNDIIELINKALGLQVILYFFEFLLVGIFGIFWTIQIMSSASVEFGSNFYFWYLYFMTMVHLILITICTTNFLVKTRVRLNLQTNNVSS